MKSALSKAIVAFICLAFAFAGLSGTVRADMDDDDWRELLYGSWHGHATLDWGFSERAIFTREECVFVPSPSYISGEIWREYGGAVHAAWDVIDGELVLYAEDSETRLPLRFYEYNDHPALQYCCEIEIGDTEYFRFSAEPDFWLTEGLIGNGSGACTELSYFGIDVIGDKIKVNGSGAFDRNYIWPTDEEWTQKLYGSWMETHPSESGYRKRVYLCEAGVLLLPDHETGESFLGLWEVKNRELCFFGSEEDDYYITKISLDIYWDNTGQPSEETVWFDWHAMRKYSNRIERDVPSRFASPWNRELFELIFTDTSDWEQGS